MIAKVVLYFHEWYIAVCRWMYAVMIIAVSAFSQVEDPDVPKLLFARIERESPGPIITDIVRVFLRYDAVCSCYSLQKWLLAWNLKASRVTLVFYRSGSVYSAEYDLDNDTELVTNKSSGDLSIMSLVGLKFLPREKLE